MNEQIFVREDRLNAARELYDAKPEGYFSGARRAFVDTLPLNVSGRLLDVGCGNGDTAAHARATRKCGWAAGVELCTEPASEARQKLDLVIEGDVEKLDLPFEPNSLDVILLSEVLEHLRDPSSLLRRLAVLLKPQGMVVAGSPNVAHYSVLRMLLAGEWRYAPQGVMDATHLRWFTSKSYRRLFEDAGFEVIEVGPARPLGGRASLINRITGGRLMHLFHTQIVLRAFRP